MNPVNNQPTLDEVKQIAGTTGVPEELLISLWDKETAQGAGLNGKQNHFGPWELTRSTYKSFVTSEAPDKFAGFPTDITKATKDQILAVSAEKLKRDWEASGGDVNKFLVKWQGNHPTIGVQNVNGISVKQADYSTPIVKYNMEQLKEKGPGVKLARNFNDLPNYAKQDAVEFFKTGKFPDRWQLDTTEQDTQQAVTPQTKTESLGSVLSSILAANSAARQQQPQEPTQTELAFQNMLGQYNSLATQYATAMTKSPQSVGDIFKFAAFRNYEAPKVEQTLKYMQSQLASLAQLMQAERENSNKVLVNELKVARAANELEKSALAVERAQLGIDAKNYDLAMKEVGLKTLETKLKAAAEAKAQNSNSDAISGIGQASSQELASSLEKLNNTRVAYLAMKDKLASPEGLKARDSYLNAIKEHYDVYNKALSGRTPKTTDLANLAELQLTMGFAKSDAASALPEDSIDRIVSHIRAKGGTIEQAIDSVFGKGDADGIAIKNIVRGKPNAIGQNTKQALMFSDPKDVTPHLVKGVDATPIYKQFIENTGKKAQLSALLENKRSDTEKAIAEQQDSKKIANAFVASYNRIAPYATGPLALNQKIGDTIAELRLNTDLFPQLAQMDVEESKLIPALTKLISNKIISLDEASAQVAQFYSELAKQKDSITRMDKLHITLPKDWTVAVGKKAIDLTKPSQVNVMLRDALVAQQTLLNSVQSMEPSFFLAP